MPYDPVEDIPNIEKLSVDFSKLSPLMHELLVTTRIAVRQPYNFKRRFHYEAELRTFLTGQLFVYGSTHNSIHILIRFLLRKKYYPPIADAASLVREQIEKIYAISLALSNPPRWIRQGLRGAWRSDYQMYLLATEEHGLNPRFEEFLARHYVEYLKSGQRPPRSKVVVSDFAKRVLTHHWNNPVGKNPSWFKKNKAVRNWIAEYFEFPTPGKSMKYIKGKSRRRFLFRWVKEYSYFSQFTHIALEKQLVPYMSQFKGREMMRKTEINSRNLLEKVIYVSFTAVASACLLILTELRDSYGARANLEELWQQLEQTSLLGRAFWNIYPKKLLR